MNNTLNNGFRVLNFLAQSGRSHSVKELAEHFKLPNSHICRLLKTLLDTGYLEQDKSRKYLVSLNILSLANACLANLDLRNIAQVHLLKLQRKLKNKVYLVKNLEGRALIVDAFGDSDEIDFKTITIGQYNSPLHSASGKLCAAYASPEQQKEILDTIEWGKACSGTAKNKSELLKNYSEITHKGYSEAVKETSEDTYAVSVPVHDADGNLTGAVGSFCSIKNSSEEQRKNMLNSLLNTADIISKSLSR